MKLCLFRPLDRDVRGWVGAIEGDRVVHLAAQSLASFFTGGGSAREHDEYALEDVRLLAPVPRPPSVRDAYAFEEHIRNAARVTGRPGVPNEWYELPVFYFSNPAAIYGPDDEILFPAGSQELDYELEVAAVIGVPPGAVVGQGHAAADAVETALHEALPESDVVVHVEPQEDEAALRERALAAAQQVPQVREIHNLSVLRTNRGAEVTLHLKLPGEMPLEEAHAVASDVERSISESLPEVVSVQTHLEPLAEPARGTPVERDAGFVEAIVRTATGAAPRELRFLETDDGLVALVTLGLDPGTTLADAHRRASEIEERIRRERPEIADVIVHTEP